DTPCIACGQCASFCPTSAISGVSHIDRIYRAIQEGKVLVAQTAPSVRVALGEEVGMPSGAITTGGMVASLRMLGFQYVVDTNFGADLTIMEEGTELLSRLQKSWDGQAVTLPMFTSCCPGWVNFVEQEAPDFMGNLSTCKSPMQMVSAMVKTYFAKMNKINPADIFHVAVMPCTAKKQEIAREIQRKTDGTFDADACITTRELGTMIRKHNIDFAHIK
ncbi:hypothetical protein KIPB_011856, partial [Kipferlia bialata]